MTQSNLSLLNKAPKEMPFKELINQRAALTRTIPLLDDESKEIAKADMAAVAKECSPKWDDLYVTRENLKLIIISRSPNCIRKDFIRFLIIAKTII